MGGQAWPGPPPHTPSTPGEQQGWENLEACFFLVVAGAFSNRASLREGWGVVGWWGVGWGRGGSRGSPARGWEEGDPQLANGGSSSGSCW